MYLVMYTGECGEQGLDMDDLLTHEGVYKATSPDGGDTKFIYSPIPFISETEYCRVVSIEEGTCNVCN